MAIVLAALTSLFIGAGESISSRETRAIRAVEITVMYFLSGFVVAVVALTSGIVPSEWSVQDLAYGAAAGVFNGFALMLLYVGYTTSSVGVTLPTAGMVSVAVPVLVDLAVVGSAPSVVLVVGVVIGTAALGLTSFSPVIGGQIAKGVALAIGAGTCYGLMLILFAQTSEESGLWPVVPARASSLAIAMLIARSTGPRAWPPSGSRRSSSVAGVLGALGLVTFALAAQRGSLTVVSVLGSQYPSVAIVGSYFLDGATIRWWQAVGLIGTLVGVILITIGSN